MTFRRIAVVLSALILHDVTATDSHGNSLVSCAACQSLQVQFWECEVSCSLKNKEDSPLWQRMTGLEAMVQELNRIVQAQTLEIHRLSIRDAMFNKDDVIIFDQISSNYGNHYQTSGDGSGKFVAPSSGTYQFQATITNRDDHPTNGIVALLVKNGVMQQRCLTGPEPWSTGVCAGVIELSAGDKVWVKCRRDRAQFSSLSTTFSGNLLLAA